MLLRKYELTIDIALLKQNFPHLIRFSDRLMRDLYVFRGIAPVEISIPKEFLFTDPPRTKPCCIGVTKIDTLTPTFEGVSLEDTGDLIAVADRASGSCLTTTELFMCPRCSLIHNARQRPPLGIDYPGQLELVQKATRAFKQTGYSYYDRYYFYRERLGVRSLFELYEYDLKKLLLLLN